MSSNQVIDPDLEAYLQKCNDRSGKAPYLRSKKNIVEAFVAVGVRADKVKEMLKGVLAIWRHKGPIDLSTTEGKDRRDEITREVKSKYQEVFGTLSGGPEQRDFLDKKGAYALVYYATTITRTRKDPKKRAVPTSTN